MQISNWISQVEELNRVVADGTNVNLNRIDVTFKSLSMADGTTVDASGNIVFSWGDNIPSGSGYAVRSIFVRKSALAGSTPSLYINLGDATAASFLPTIGFEQQPNLAAATPVTVTISKAGSSYITSIADVVFNLPDITTCPYGMRLTFVNNSVSAGAGTAISPSTLDQIVGLGITPADNKDLINTAATDVAGDFVTLVGDGANVWYVTASRGIWAREA
jgi:hypothetical protein